MIKVIWVFVVLYLAARAAFQDVWVQRRPHKHKVLCSGSPSCLVSALGEATGCLLLSAKLSCFGCWSVSMTQKSTQKKQRKRKSVLTFSQGEKSIKVGMGKICFALNRNFCRTFILKCCMSTCCEKQQFFILQISDTVNSFPLCRQ